MESRPLQQTIGLQSATGLIKDLNEDWEYNEESVSKQYPTKAHSVKCFVFGWFQPVLVQKKMVRKKVIEKKMKFDDFILALKDERAKKTILGRGNFKRNLMEI